MRASWIKTALAHGASVLSAQNTNRAKQKKKINQRRSQKMKKRNIELSLRVANIALGGRRECLHFRSELGLSSSEKLKKG